MYVLEFKVHVVKSEQEARGQWHHTVASFALKKKGLIRKMPVKDPQK